MAEKEPLYLCMGSACHQVGTYTLLPVIQQWLVQNRLSDRIELKGTFCLGECQHGIVLKFRGDVITDINIKNIEEKLAEYVASRLQLADPAVVDSCG